MATNKKTFAYVRSNFQSKINWYQVLLSQTTGSAGKWRPTAAQLSTLARWVDKGACVQKVSPAQLNRWAGTPRSWTPGAARTTLARKFGKAAIKAVAVSKTGGFLVATSQMRNGRPFRIN